MHGAKFGKPVESDGRPWTKTRIALIVLWVLIAIGSIYWVKWING